MSESNPSGVIKDTVMVRAFVEAERKRRTKQGRKPHVVVANPSTKKESKMPNKAVTKKRYGNYLITDKAKPPAPKTKPKAERDGRSKYPFEVLKVGESFAFSVKDSTKVSVAAATWAKDNGNTKHFFVRKVSKTRSRCWCSRVGTKVMPGNFPTQPKKKLSAKKGA